VVVAFTAAGRAVDADGGAFSARRLLIDLNAIALFSRIHTRAPAWGFQSK
jgi:hypothetical protein